MCRHDRGKIPDSAGRCLPGSDLLPGWLRPSKGEQPRRETKSCRAAIETAEAAAGAGPEHPTRPDALSVSAGSSWPTSLLPPDLTPPPFSLTGGGRLCCGGKLRTGQPVFRLRDYGFPSTRRCEQSGNGCGDAAASKLSVRTNRITFILLTVQFLRGSDGTSERGVHGGPSSACCAFDPARRLPQRCW